MQPIDRKARFSAAYVRSQWNANRRVNGVGKQYCEGCDKKRECIESEFGTTMCFDCFKDTYE